MRQRERKLSPKCLRAKREKNKKRTPRYRGGQAPIKRVRQNSIKSSEIFGAESGEISFLLPSLLYNLVNCTFVNGLYSPKNRGFVKFITIKIGAITIKIGAITI